MTPHARPFLRFAGIGILGFGVDVAVLYAMLALGLDYISGRLISFAVAVTFTWRANRSFTFAESTSDHLFSEWLRFFAANLTGATINFLTYLAVMQILTAPGLAALAVAAGSLSGLVFNYTASRLFVFR